MEKHTSRRRSQKYKSLNNRLRRITDKAREIWWDKQCAELEKHERQGYTDLLYRRKVSQVTNRKRKKQSLRK